jgi:hypothetical protein
LIMRCLFLLATLLIVSFSAEAQLLGIGRKAKAGEAPPKAVLIEILTRKNQREFIEARRPDLLPQFSHDVTEVAKRTVKDWSTYFRFCPVYFFIDTMADKVTKGEWEGVLLDSTLTPFATPPLPNGERNVYVAYYGSPMPQPDTVRAPSTRSQYMEHDGDETTSLIRERLLITDVDFRLLPETGPRTNYVRALRPGWMGTTDYRKYRHSLTYNSSKWYIDYSPVAHSYDATLRRYFRGKF